jgi:hypothetical protein
MNEQQYIQRINQLEFQLQEQHAHYVALYQASKKLIDAAILYSKTETGAQKKQNFLILKNREQQLKELIYPNTKKSSQAKIEWLGQ